MRRLSLAAVCGAVALFGVSASGVVAGEQTYKEKTIALTKVLKAKKASTDAITEAIDAVSDGYADASVAEKKAGLAAIGKAAKSKNAEVVLGCFEALSLLQAPGSGKYLKPYLRIGKKGPYSKLQRAAVSTAGEVGDKSILKELRRLSDHKLDEVAEEATKALGGYSRLPPKERKVLAFSLITRLQKLSQSSGGGRGYGRGLAESTNDKEDATGVPDGQIGSDGKADNRRSLLAGATRTAVSDLTGLRFIEVSEWNEWVSGARSVEDPWKKEAPATK